MNDQEADAQVQQMCNFILAEARTQADEVQKKTLDDFNVEKLKLVQSLKESIRSEYETKVKKQTTSKAIERSASINKARLSKIAKRHDCIETLGDNCKSAINSVIAGGNEQYRGIVVDLIVQGAFKLMEREITVKARQSDVQLVRSCLDAAATKFTSVIKQVTGVTQNVRFTLSNEYLPATSLGGVVLSCANGKILVDNSLDARLKLCMEAERPALRKILFEGK